MEDDFYEPRPVPSSGLTSKLLQSIISVPPSLLITVLFAPILLIIATRLLSERPSREAGKNGRTVWMLPYWFPVLGHGISILRDPMKLMAEARDQSHGIFALNLGSSTHNILSDPSLVKSAMAQKESEVEFHSIAWNVSSKFFGLTNKPKYDKIWPQLKSLLGHLMKEPELSSMLKPTIRYLEENIPRMITFIDTEIDIQPWERLSNTKFISDTEVEINLMSLMRDMLGHASVPAMFGRGLLEKYPALLHDVYDMDEGMIFFLMGLPPWTPWPGVFKAHMARRRLWHALDDQQRALDALSNGEDPDYSWGDLDDVSEFILKRHELYENNGFDVKERGDISILWALIVNANLLVYWHILYILSTPSLLSEIRAEIAPYTKITEPESIGRISEAPKLTISHDGLAKECPLFRATYLEALRISGQPWSVRKVISDVSLSYDKQATELKTYDLKKGEYITIPHELHMRDPGYFLYPAKFIPDRFLIHNEDGSLSTNPGTIKPFGGGPSICKGRLFAERECLALVAGVLMLWEIEPVGKNWVVPEMVKRSAVSKPKIDTRVRIRRRKFEWDE